MRATDQGLVVVVADGVGSTPEAHLAATTAANACAAFPWTAPNDRDSWKATVNRALIAVQAALCQEVPSCREDADGSRRPSTTLVMGLVAQSNSQAVVYWFTIGDSAIIRLPRKLGAGNRLEIVNAAPLSPDPTTAALPSSRAVVEEGALEFDPSREFLVLATDGCAKPMRQNPELYAPDFLAISERSADASHLLAAIRQDGAGFDDDSTAILIGLVGGVR